MKARNNSANFVEPREETSLALSSHPSLPLYVSSRLKEPVVSLWHFNAEPLLATFITPTQNPLYNLNSHGAGNKRRNLLQRSSTYSISKKPSDRIFRLRFNNFGNKLGGISNNGNLHIWHFNVPRSVKRREFKSFQNHECHDKRGADLRFLLGSCSVATAGECTSNENVRVWDFLYSERGCLIRSFKCYEGGGAYCLEYVRDRSVLVSGGLKGLFCLMDPRTAKVVGGWESGSSRIWCLDYHEPSQRILSGSLDGVVKIWDVRKLVSSKGDKQIDFLTALDHEEAFFSKHTFLTNPWGPGYMTSLGLFDAKWTARGDILLAGADGSVKLVRRQT